MRSPRGVALLRSIDTLLAPARWARPPPVPAAPTRILVCNWAHRGDVLLSLPCLQALRRLFPAAEIGVLVGPAGVGVVAGTGLYDRLHVVDHPMLSRAPGTFRTRLGRYLRDRRRLLRELRAARYEVALELYCYLPSAAPLLWRAGIPVRCGFTSGGFGPLLTHPVTWSWRNRSMTEIAGDLIAALWPDANIGALAPCYPGVGKPPSATTACLVLHPGSGAISREWPEERWATLLAALARGTAGLTLCGVGPREAARARRLAALAPAGRVTLFLDRPWPEFVTLIAGAAGLVCLESASGHVAAAFGVPTVAIYTGTNEPRLWGPNNPRARVLTAPTGCAPCHRDGCAAMACVRGVTPDAVLAALRELGVPIG